MSFVAEKVDEKRYVLLDFECSVTISELEQSRTAIKGLLRESSGYRKILVDMRKVSLAVSTIDVHRFVASHKDELPAGCLIAVIVDPKDWEIAIFSENVAHMRGVYLRAFRDALQARNWLGISDPY